MGNPDGLSGREMRYSVVIPAYNAEETLAEAIESVLSQTAPAEKIVVVDDGSVDATAAIAGRYGAPVVVIGQDNAGVSAATNRGIDAVDTPFLACLDADDLWLPEKAARQLAYLSANAETDGVFARLRQFLQGRPVDPSTPGRDNWGRTTMMIRTASARRVGALADPAGGGGRGDMVDWVSRCRDLGLRLELLPEVLALRRVRPGSMSHGFDQRSIGYLRAVKAALDRRRKKRLDRES